MKMFIEFAENLIPKFESPVAYISKDFHLGRKNENGFREIEDYIIYLTLNITDDHHPYDSPILAEHFDSEAEMLSRWQELRDTEI